ncbi:3-methyl-2-oxobutanoate hydroxymethyltransferase KNAG_0A03460 [Huiozyma naganishii CBS 8797]|uniref:3-methyl-2-oxobutanoate hydroxymethyltransferase n=1 Tax=Huiozyma naganishii (strain ATCC MYA-139 / BCRC 22969 / CBS 8797 / KCTC 17520 / NBRC 10181 / NCYC 3082 / Yp74L-3) TaxID=1071383 RepID=J7S291_HUIN7|nr:hypothetical protein KNAG_0A03460 [Kazachstania naganishii CBS 8797]CCK68029.1 hypothetical protein KNAG_0A03460 [Kazachstania naganishii CBS 8797]
MGTNAVTRLLFHRGLVPRRWSSHSAAQLARTTLSDITGRYAQREPLTMCTAYDYITARWAQASGANLLLVGDSMATTALGYDAPTDLPFDEFKQHLRSVCRAAGPAAIVADMPFGSLEQSIEHGVSSAVALMKISSKVTSVKVELGTPGVDTHTYALVQELTSRGIPVMGHLGLTPQRAHSLGGLRVQANGTVEQAVRLLESAQQAQASGCWAVVLECVPQRLATYITEQLQIPTIGIGAGPGTSGQVLVIADMLELLGEGAFRPKFAKRYAQLGKAAEKSLAQFTAEVQRGQFPVKGTHTFMMKDDLWQEFLRTVESRQ